MGACRKDYMASITGTVAISEEQLAKLGEAVQARLDVIITTDRRAGIISQRIVDRALHLSDDVYPKMSDVINQTKGLPIFDNVINETSDLADDMNDWIETLEILGEEYHSIKNMIVGFRERLP